MIMDEFLGNVQKHMIQLKKKNMNLINQFKIEMFQARKNIEKNIIKFEFGITDSQLINEKQVKQNESIFQRQSKNNVIDKNLSTNYNSRANESKVNDNCQISRFTHNFNKQNEDPNRRMHTDISVIEELPLKNNTFQSNEQMYNELNLNALKNDESIEINTEQVKKKYQKFMSPSAGWTVSGDPLRQHKGREFEPFCTQFFYEGQNFGNQENESIRKDLDMFGFRQIDDKHFSRTNTIQELQCEQNNESQNY